MVQAFVLASITSGTWLTVLLRGDPLPAGPTGTSLQIVNILIIALRMVLTVDPLTSISLDQQETALCVVHLQISDANGLKTVVGRDRIAHIPSMNRYALRGWRDSVQTYHLFIISSDPGFYQPIIIK